MKNSTAADIGTAFVLYQSVLEILDEETRARLEAGAIERFKKFRSRSIEIDDILQSEVDAIGKNCEKFCSMALDGIFEMLEKHFPVENVPE